jgi:uncharacterized protein (DUF736 family)
MPDFKKDPNEIGALWIKHGNRGDYMTGAIEIDGVKTPIVCFTIDAKSEKAPNWRVLKSVPRDGGAR